MDWIDPRKAPPKPFVDYWLFARRGLGVFYAVGHLTQSRGWVVNGVSGGPENRRPEVVRYAEIECPEGFDHADH